MGFSFLQQENLLPGPTFGPTLFPELITLTDTDADSNVLELDR